MPYKFSIAVTLLGALGGMCACSIQSNEPGPAETSPVEAVSAPLLGLPTIGLPGVFHFTDGLLAGQVVPEGLTMIADADIVTRDDEGGTPSLAAFPRAVDLLGNSYRKLGAYVDTTKAPVPVPLANGKMGSRPFLKYVEARGGAELRKSAASGADSSALVPSGRTLKVVAVTWADVPRSLSTLPADVPGLDVGYWTSREPISMLFKCPRTRPNTAECVDSPSGEWIALHAGRTDLLFATANGMSFNADGTAVDGNQYFMLNEAGTAYDQVVYAGTAYAFSEDDYAYLQTNYAYASWTPLLADSFPWFFTRQ